MRLYDQFAVVRRLQIRERIDGDSSLPATSCVILSYLGIVPILQIRTHLDGRVAVYFLNPTRSMDPWVQPMAQPVEAFAEASSSIAPSTASPSPPMSPKKEERKLNLAHLLSELPSYQEAVFEPLEMAEPFSPGVQIPPGTDITSAYSLFSLFISEDLIALLSANTNKYAQTKNALATGRGWHETSPAEIKIFLAILIYMGIHISPSDEDYWQAAEEPIHMPRRFMGLKRFQQIKRFFHVADPDPETAVQEALKLNLRPSQMWWYKLEPFASRLRAACLQYWRPSNAVSIDESMIRGFGRSHQTFKMPNKPIKQGYKLFAIADQGYILYWMWASRHKSLVEVHKQADLTVTGSMVLQLVQQGLPPCRNQYTVYLDNYFTTIPLFHRLRELGFGACGTTRPNASKSLFPKALRVLKDSKKPLRWNKLYAVPACMDPSSGVDSVLCIAWQDNNLVTALSTVHTVHRPNDWVTRLRRRPAKTSTSAKVAREPFDDQSAKDLSIPRMIDDYNFHMGGVDRANQLRASYETHQRTWRSWWPIFFWILDVAIINAYCIAKVAQQQQDVKPVTHLEFRKALYRQLFERGQRESNLVSRKRQREPEEPVKPVQEGEHKVERISPRKWCNWCKRQADQAKSKGRPIPTVFQTSFRCKGCGIPLCKRGTRPCWNEFHHPRAPLRERDVNRV